jgi:hypothetical protein
MDCHNVAFWSVQEYAGNEFEVTFGDGISDLYRVYTKRMKDGRIKVRSESQQRPDQEYADAIVRKLFPDGYLVDPVNAN